MSASKTGSAPFQLASLFRNIYTLSSVLPFRGSHAGPKATTAGIHPGYDKPEMDSVKVKVKDKPVISTNDQSPNEGGRTLLSRRKKKCSHIIAVCLVWSLVSLWLLMSVLLIASGILFDCPSDANNMIKGYAILHGSCNICFAVVFTLSMIVDNDEYDCLGYCPVILYIFSFLSGFFILLNLLFSLEAWKNGDFICSNALYVGELIYFCVVCISCGVLCGVVPFLA